MYEARVAIIGSRDFPVKPIVERFVYQLPKEWIIVSGGARGVDTWAEETASYWGRQTDVYRADWKRHGKSAGFVRNNEIIRNCDVVIAFWDGKSRGTKHSIQLAKYLNKPCIIVRSE